MLPFNFLEDLVNALCDALDALEVELRQAYGFCSEHNIASYHVDHQDLSSVLSHIETCITVLVTSILPKFQVVIVHTLLEISPCLSSCPCEFLVSAFQSRPTLWYTQQALRTQDL